MNIVFQPAEWMPHECVWTALPSHPELWQENYKEAQSQVAQLCLEISKSEKVHILVCGERALEEAKGLFKGAHNIFLHSTVFGDNWLRDTAPIFVKEGGQSAARIFRFNGWGEKYLLDGDQGVAPFVAELSGLSAKRSHLILEGGSLDVDGEGTALTTKECLLNPNRNPALDQQAIEEILETALGLKKILWLEGGLLNDHTDGHIDNVARFVGPGKVVCMRPSGENDPNKEILLKIQNDLSQMKDIRGRPLQVFTVPSAGYLTNDEGKVIPASHVNLYISNKSVIVPLYGTEFDQEVIQDFEKIFPERKIVGLRANAVLSGGGSFHCITQQQPL